MSETRMTTHHPRATVTEQQAAVDAIDASDPEVAHGLADEILLACVDERVRAAYLRLMARCAWWAGA